MVWFLASHVDQGFIFGTLGVWHMYNTLQNYVRSPINFQSSTWFPARGRRLPKPLELWILLFIIVVFIFKQLSHATADIAAGQIQSAHLGRFQHVVFAFFFLVYIVTALLAEYTPFLPLPPGALHCTFASGFLMELVVFHFGHHPGEDLESFLHMLMQFILLFLVLLMFLEVYHPHNILLSVARCMMLVLKGTWFAQIGFILYYPSFVPAGCFTDKDHEYPVCPTHEILMRAKSIQVLIFNLQLLFIVIATFVGFAGLVFWSRRRPGTPRPAGILVPTPRTREKEASVYFQVPEEVEVEDEESAESTALKSLSRRVSSRNAKDTAAVHVGSPILG